VSKFYLFVSIALVVAMVVFALINSAAVTVNLFWFAEIKAPLVIVILCALVLGIFIMGLFDLGRQFRTGKDLKDARKKLKVAEEESEALRLRVRELNSRDQNPEPNQQ